EARRDVLLVLLPRLAQVDVEVDEAGRDPAARAVDHLDALALEAARGPTADAQDAPALDDDVGLLVATALRIEDPTALQHSEHRAAAYASADLASTGEARRDRPRERAIAPGSAARSRAERA